MERVSLIRHIHTHDHQTPSQSVGLDAIKARYAQVDALILEDHGEFLPTRLPQGTIPGPVLLHGNEWATPITPTGRPQINHHVGMLGVDASEQEVLQIRGTDPPAQMQKKIHDAGGAMVMNHPEWPYIDQPAFKNRRSQVLDYTFPVEQAQPFDAVELFNDAGFKGNDPLEVLRWVERVFYDRGLFPAMVGGQDDHGPSVIAKRPSYTLLMAQDKREESVMEAIRAGRTYVSKSLGAGLEMTLDGQSVWDRPRLRATELAVSLSGIPDGSKLELVRNGTVVAETTVHGGAAHLDWLLPRTIRPTDYVYVRAFSPEGDLHTVSSAVLLAPH